MLCVRAHAYTNSRRRLVMATTTVAPATASPPTGVGMCAHSVEITNEGITNQGVCAWFTFPLSLAGNSQALRNRPAVM